MKSEIELTEDIMAITLKIEANYPELLKFIEEMPDKSDFSDNNITTTNLSGYYDSLDTLFEDYSLSHSSNTEPYMDYFIT